MDTAGYVVLSRQLGLFRQMDSIANNIANAESTAFKSEQMLFQQFIIGNGDGVDGDRDVAFTSDVATIRDLSQGAFVETGRQLDSAINGDGYFVVNTPLGVRYSRAGSFQVNPQGELVTPEGYRLQGAGGPIVLAETDKEIIIRGDGTVAAKVVGGTQEERGVLQVVKFADQRDLDHAGGNFYRAEDIAAIPALAGDDYSIVQGVIEKSNVNTINEVTSMIKVNRSVSTTSNFMNQLHDLERRMISTVSAQQ